MLLLLLLVIIPLLYDLCCIRLYSHNLPSQYDGVIFCIYENYIVFVLYDCCAVVCKIDFVFPGIVVYTLYYKVRYRCESTLNAQWWPSVPTRAITCKTDKINPPLSFWSPLDRALCRIDSSFEPLHTFFAVRLWDANFEKGENIFQRIDDIVITLLCFSDDKKNVHRNYILWLVTYAYTEFLHLFHYNCNLARDLRRKTIFQNWFITNASIF